MVVFYGSENIWYCLDLYFTNIKNSEHFFGFSSYSDNLQIICQAYAFWIFAPNTPSDQFYNLVCQEMRFENVLWQNLGKGCDILNFAYILSLLVTQTCRHSWRQALKNRAKFQMILGRQGTDKKLEFIIEFKEIFRIFIDCICCKFCLETKSKEWQ